MYKIEKGVPLPTRSTRRKYPFRELGVGDSFFVPEKDPKARRAVAQSIRTSFHRHKPKVFTAHETPNGVRVWRIK